MNTEEIRELKDNIELLSKSYQIEIGRLFLSNNIQIDENKNGIFKPMLFDMLSFLVIFK